jgi:hypothetical protein
VLGTRFLRLSLRGAFGRFPLRRREDAQGAVVSASTFGPDFHQQFGTHLVEESKAAWRGRDRQAPKPPRLRRQPHL